MSKYSEKLRDPRWQKKRLQILERDQWKCRQCHSDDTTLHVHHIAYHGEPWECLDKLLITLCEDCHILETEFLKQARIELIADLKNAGLMALPLSHISKIFKDTDRDWNFYEPAFDILKMVVDDDELWKQMSELFWKRLSNKTNE